MSKPIPLAREALGTRRFTYTVGIAQRLDGSFELLVSAIGQQKEHHMPEPSPEKRAFTADDLDALGVQASAFLQEWRSAQPDAGNRVLCCTKAIDNAIARARKKLVTLATEAERRANL
jgi:hypothetical protein